MKIDKAPRRLLTFSSACGNESFYFKGLVKDDTLPYEIWEGKSEYEMRQIKMNEYLMEDIIPVFIEYDGEKGKRSSEFPIEGWKKVGDFYFPEDKSSFSTLCHIARVKTKAKAS